MAAATNAARAVFLAAVDLPSAAERALYLDKACAGDAALRQRVEALLHAHDDPGAFLSAASAGSAATTAYAPPLVGTVIAGRYKLLEAIGEGGMGTVWVAEQTEPVSRKVAIKLIKAGMDSKSVLARFEGKRQALAVMDHPNIAKVLDGGLTEAGRPFFVMEYVKGVPITEYCDSARLSVPQRLNLFVQVCLAVQHAHQKGIIHRDLKPTNILVAPYDDRPVPKVIDFGLAKAIHQPLTDRTLHTAHDSVLGTPLYMSPEQAQLNNLDVDTRSDIYSLGVLLYELLTGTTPPEKRRFKEAMWDEVQRIICEEEPPRPTTRLSSAGTLPSLAAVRQMEPARLTKLVRGDLDWIVMKALDKDRNRRYDTANGFALDVQRFLAEEPVLAAPPSVRYRLGKPARKYRAALATAAAIGLLLAAGSVVSTWQAVRATRAEGRARANADDALAAAQAEAREREKASQAERAARIEAEKSKAINDFLLHDLLAEAAPENNSVGSRITVRELLDSAAEKVGPAFEKQPESEAAIRKTIGRTYNSLGLFSEAEVQLRKARALHQKTLGPGHPDSLNVMNALVYSLCSARKRDEAETLARECLSLSAGASKHRLCPRHLVKTAGHAGRLRARSADLPRSFGDVSENSRKLRLGAGLCQDSLGRAPHGKRELHRGRAFAPGRLQGVGRRCPEATRDVSLGHARPSPPDKDAGGPGSTLRGLGQERRNGPLEEGTRNRGIARESRRDHVRAPRHAGAFSERTTQRKFPGNGLHEPE
jgi:non-specific serine/threonine protein kinase/serine/threonine-protein kinase